MEKMQELTDKLSKEFIDLIESDLIDFFNATRDKHSSHTATIAILKGSLINALSAARLIYTHSDMNAEVLYCLKQDFLMISNQIENIKN